MCSISDCKEDAFKVESSSKTESRVRCRIQVNYLGKGLFLVVYRMYHSYADMSIAITHNGRHVSGSPYVLGAVFHENCACPLKTPEQWLEDFQCPDTEDQILEDLAPFRKEGVNVTGLYKRIEEMYPRNSLVHYSIVNGKVKKEPSSRRPVVPMPLQSPSIAPRLLYCIKDCR